MPTKRQIIEAAYEEIALSGHVFDLDGETSRMALQKLDGLMGQWLARGIDVAYNFPVADLDSDQDDDSGLSFAAYEPAYMALAVRLAASHGKQLSQDTRQAARDGFNALATAAARPKGPYMPQGMPLGAGNLRHGRVFSGAPDAGYTRFDPITGTWVAVE